jgi:hypothetical protein
MTDHDRYFRISPYTCVRVRPLIRKMRHEVSYVMRLGGKPNSNALEGETSVLN